jgi:hypothetical protein
MAEFDPVGFGERLSLAMEKAGIPDVRALQKRLAKKTTERGTSYPQVWSYVNGRAPDSGPRRAIVEALADILRVRPEYLLHDGPRTETERQAGERATAALHPPVAAWANDIEALFNENFPGLDRPTLGPGPAARAQLWRLWTAVQYVRAMVAMLSGVSAEELDQHEAEYAIAAAQQVIQAVLAPLHELDALPPAYAAPGHLQGRDSVNFAAAMFGDRLDSYVITTCETLLAVSRRQESMLSDRLYREQEEAADDEA